MKNLSHGFGLKEDINSRFVFVLTPDKRTEIAVNQNKIWEKEAQNEIRDQVNKDLDTLDPFKNAKLADLSVTVKAGDTIGALAYGFDRAEKALAEKENGGKLFATRQKLLDAKRFNITPKTKVKFYNKDKSQKIKEGTVGGGGNANLIHEGQTLKFAADTNYAITKDVVIQVLDKEGEEHNYTEEARGTSASEKGSGLPGVGKSTIYPEPDPNPKPEPKPEPNPEPNPEPKPDPKPKPDPEPEPIRGVEKTRVKELLGAESGKETYKEKEYNWKVLDNGNVQVTGDALNFEIPANKFKDGDVDEAKKVIVKKIKLKLSSL